MNAIAFMICMAFAILSITNFPAGLALITATRPVILMAQLEISKSTLSADGIISMILIAVCFFVLLFRGFSVIKSLSIVPFCLFIFASTLSAVYATDYYLFWKKLFRIIGYLALYVNFAILSESAKSRRLIENSYLVAIVISVVSTLYVFFANQAYYMQQDSNNAVSSVFSKNNLGFFFCYSIFFLLYMIYAYKGRTIRRFCTALLVMSFICFVLAYTRSAWVGFAAGFIFLFRFSEVRKKSTIPIILLLVIGFGLFSQKIYHGIYGDVTTKRVYGVSSWDFRVKYAWPASIKAFKASPYFGHGLGDNLGAMKRKANFHLTSHNDYLVILVETGIIGLLFYVFLLLSLFRRTYVNAVSAITSETKYLSVCTLCILVAYMVGSIAEHLLQTPGATGYAITMLGMAHGARNADILQASIE